MSKTLIKNQKLQEIINNLWEIKESNKEQLLKNKKYILKVIELLDKGILRVVDNINNQWVVNEYVKKAILLYFMVSKTKKINFKGVTYYDKIPLKKDLKKY